MAPLVLGIALGDLLAGLPINEDGVFTGRVWSFFTGFGVWTGLTLVALCLLHGATFLAIRTTDEVRRRATRWSWMLGVVALVMVVVFAVWTALIAQPGWPAYLLLAVALLAIVGGFIASRRGSEKAAFVATAIAIAATVGSRSPACSPTSSSRAPTASTASPSPAARRATTRSR